MFRKLKSIVVFLKIIVSFVLTRPFGKFYFELKDNGSEDGNSSDEDPVI